MTFVRKHPLLSFFVLTYGLSWAYWIPLALAGIRTAPGFPHDSFSRPAWSGALCFHHHRSHSRQSGHRGTRPATRTRVATGVAFLHLQPQPRHLPCARRRIGQGGPNRTAALGRLRHLFRPATTRGPGGPAAGPAVQRLRRRNRLAGFRTRASPRPLPFVSDTPPGMLRTSAAVPATCGEAIEVPLSTW